MSYWTFPTEQQAVAAMPAPDEPDGQAWDTAWKTKAGTWAIAAPPGLPLPVGATAMTGLEGARAGAPMKRS